MEELPGAPPPGPPPRRCSLSLAGPLAAPRTPCLAPLIFFMLLRLCLGQVQVHEFLEHVLAISPRTAPVKFVGYSEYPDCFFSVTMISSRSPSMHGGMWVREDPFSEYGII